MKEIKAYTCDHCNKIARTRQTIRKHEPICFQNPESKSCATCVHLGYRNVLRGEQLTNKEEDILQYKVPETYTMIMDNEDGYEFPYLKPEFKYLEESEPVHYCEARKELLRYRLSTNCMVHKTK